MRAICFGRVNVSNAGTPVRMGSSVLSTSMGANDESLAVAYTASFCGDMIPFKMDIDPAGASSETVVVTGMSGSTFTVQRGALGISPVSHASGAVAMARFAFAGWRLSVVAGLTGKMYWGSKNLSVSVSAGVICEFWPNAAGGVDDDYDFMSNSQDGNPLALTDYSVDSIVNGEGLYVTLWER